MRFVLKVLLLCMVAIAVPFQGYAAAAMLGCAQGGPAPRHHAGAPATHHVAQAAPGHSGHDMYGPGHSMLVTPGDKADPDASDKAAACAALCMAAAAMEAPSVAAPAGAQGIAPFIAPDRYVPGANPAPLERPPRLA